MLVKALRMRWPNVEIVLRGDSAFCRWRMLRWCEGLGVGRIVGIGKNSVLMESAAGLVAQAECGQGAKRQKRKAVRLVHVQGGHLGPGAPRDRQG